MPRFFENAHVRMLGRAKPTGRTRGRLNGQRAVLAVTSQRGSGCKEMQDDQGMWIVPASTVHLAR